jgi:hypothetical protein
MRRVQMNVHRHPSRKVCGPVFRSSIPVDRDEFLRFTYYLQIFFYITSNWQNHYYMPCRIQRHRPPRIFIFLGKDLASPVSLALLEVHTGALGSGVKRGDLRSRAEFPRKAIRASIGKSSSVKLPKAIDGSNRRAETTVARTRVREQPAKRAGLAEYPIANKMADRRMHGVDGGSMPVERSRHGAEIDCRRSLILTFLTRAAAGQSLFRSQRGSCDPAVPKVDSHRAPPRAAAGWVSERDALL